MSAQRGKDAILNNAPVEISLKTAVHWIRYTYRNERIHSRDHVRRWTPARLLRLVRPNLDRPVFAIGAPRSGTTFLGQCLAELPEISYHFEPVLTKAAVRCVHDGDWPDWQARLIYRTTYAWLMRPQPTNPIRNFLWCVDTDYLSSAAVAATASAMARTSSAV